MSESVTSQTSPENTWFGTGQCANKGGKGTAGPTLRAPQPIAAADDAW